MATNGISRRQALGAMAGATALPGLTRAQAAAEVRVIIQFGVSYLPLMMIEEEKLLGAALAEQGDPRVEVKLQRVSGSNAVNEGLLAGTADMGVMGSPSLLILAEKSRGAFKGLAGCSSFPMVLNTRFVDQNPKLSAAMVKAMEVAMQRIKADPAKAAALYLKQEPSKSLSPEYVEKILRDPENVFSVAPGGVMAYADFMQRTGQLKTRPAKWQDPFFPFIQERQGS
jgi:ABC-type nitrate/sulfonate/bicarbonate transport system substrate-binding protein